VKTTPLFRGDEDGLFDYVEPGASVPRVMQRTNKAKFDPAFGRKIKSARMKFGVKQDEFAKLVGVHQVTMSRYETGTIGIPDLRRARIEEVLRDLEEKS
jgi:DNA-binding XRE family transcriptional regulator